MQKKKIYRLLESISYYGFGNDAWGVCHDVVSTFSHFGTIKEKCLDGEWCYVWVEEVESCPRLVHDVLPDHILECEDGGYYLFYSL